MSPAQLERLGEHLQRLRLFKSRERLEALLQQAAAEELPYAEFLDRVLGEEVASKTAKNITMRTNLARFPFVNPGFSFEDGVAVTYFRVRGCTLSSAQTRFTVLFGMGRRGSKLLWPPHRRRMKK